MHRRFAAVAAVLSLALAGCSAAGTTSADSDKDPETGVHLASKASEQWSFQESLATRSPADLALPPPPACARKRLPVGWAAAENSLPGDTGWTAVSRDDNPAVAVYLDSTSTYCGQSVRVHLSASNGGTVVVRVYRIGWYGGAGARLEWHSGPINVPALPPGPSTSTSLGSPGWPTAVSIPVGRNWVPGLYLVETSVGGVPGGAAPLVVRSAVTNGPYVMVHSSLTWAAYSRYGGTSLYRGPGGSSERALETSLQRPTTGAGIEQVLWNEVPLAQFTDRLGLPVDHVTDLNVDTQPSLLLRHATVVLPGHSEYWTTRMYDAITGARNLGVNIADLGANEIYWHARVERVGALPTTLYVGRTVGQDPLAAIDPALTTVEWRVAPLNRDPTAVIGQGYGAVQIRGSSMVESLPAWLAGGTGLHVGDILSGLLANEGDGARAKVPGTPPNLQVIFAAVVRRKGFGDAPITTTYYSAPSGAGVFAAGVTFWTCNLNDACPDGLGASSLTRYELRALTANLLDGFAEPRFGASHPSVRLVPPSTPALLHSLPKAAIGRYGPGS